VSVGSVFVQLTLSLLLLRREFERRLDFAPRGPVVTEPTTPAEAISG
jgi:hypothetical protein